MGNALRFATIAAIGLWILTAVFGLWAIVAVVQDILPRVFATLALSRSGYEVAYNLLTLLLSIIWIVVVIGGGEYHRTRIGLPRSWQLFGWTIGIEMVILLVAALV